MTLHISEKIRSTMIQQALDEDIRDGDITAQLLPDDKVGIARIITREPMVLCGLDWLKQCFLAVDADMSFNHQRKDGDTLVENDVIIEITGRSKSLLTAERAGLNFLQTLSSTATITHEYASKISHTDCKILDTRKTIPGLRMAQKYAVTVGGGMNHRIGLFDAILIKENHIQACGSIKNALEKAYQIAAKDMLIEIEVENIEQMLEALSHGAKRIMLDNFTPQLMAEAVKINRGTNQPAELEASGNITLDNIIDYAQTGVNYISLGALTKHIRAIDLSMRLID